MRITRGTFLFPCLVLLGACASPGGPTPDRGATSALDIDALIAWNADLRPKSGSFTSWLDAEHYLWAGAGSSIAQGPQVVDARSGASRPLFDAARLEAALAGLAGVQAAQAKEWSQRSAYTTAPDHGTLLLDEGADLIAWRIGEEHARRLTNDPAAEEGATFAPDGTHIAFVKENDLWVVPSTGGDARALTSEGDEDHLLGRLDWVYQEEVYGRGNWGAFWWSPDSQRIAFLALDETSVPRYTIVDHRQPHPEVEVWRYPKAGDPNPIVTLHVVEVASGTRTAVDLSRWAGEQLLIVRAGWTPDASALVFQVQDRIQTWLDLCTADPRTGAVTHLLRDATRTWIEPVDGLAWLENGARFLWLSPRDGWAHLYLYRRDGTLERRLTQGEFEIDRLHGVNERSGVAWVDCDRDDVKGSQLYRVGLDGSGLQRVTRETGTHALEPAPDFGLFVDTFGSAREPTRIDVVDATGARVRAIEAVDPAKLAARGYQAPEFVQVPTRDGFAMEAMLLRPPSFDARRKYPVVCFAYAGPHASQVRDSTPGFNALYHQMLARAGNVVWVCDNRSASGKGHVSTQGVYRNLGPQELADLEDGLDWLVAQGFVDESRVALWGWSYGGYMTSYALTHSRRFALGIAGAPVTDWHLYDSIYTERLMDLPAANPAGYARGSVLEAAASLSGKLLVIHGEIDENVHAQNSLMLCQRLQDAGKTFCLMIYPGNRHPVVVPAQRRHLYLTMSEFIRENL
jgi:dipeptidyl-peptidase-4